MRTAVFCGLLLLSPVRLRAQAQLLPSEELARGSTVPFAAATSSGPILALTPDPFADRKVEAIHIERINVFDPKVPGEDWWAFRLATKIHFKTREQVVKRELLLGPGDAWQPLRGLESERNLRSLGFFRRADIKPVERPDGKVELNVRTQDSWTTNAQFGAGTEGGEKLLSYGFSEDNLLGYGKSVSFLHTEKGPKKLTLWTYDDTRVLGSRVRLTPFYGRTNRGESTGVSAIRPFFSLETPYALGSSWVRTVDEAILYRDAEEYSKFIQATRQVFGGYGMRLEPDRFFVQRVEAGWWAQKDQFNPTGDTVAGTLPTNRELSGPALGYSWVEPRYIKETYIDRMERVEDYNLGNELTALAGYMARRTGSDRDRVLFRVMDQQGLLLMPGRFLLAQVGMSGRVAAQNWDNALFFTNLNAFWKTGIVYPQTLVAHIEANSGRNLDGENQILLGGDTGLRGYKNRSFVGGRSVLLNFEDRVFFPGEYFHLMRFGAAAFFDSGAAVPEGSGFSFGRFRSDVGVGLRMSSTRSQTGNVVRFDVAYALNSGPGGSRVVVTLKGRQAFQIFNSSTRRVRQTPDPQLNVRPPP